MNASKAIIRISPQFLNLRDSKVIRGAKEWKILSFDPEYKGKSSVPYLGIRYETGELMERRPGFSTENFTQTPPSYFLPKYTGRITIRHSRGKRTFTFEEGKLLSSGDPRVDLLLKGRVENLA